MTDDVVTMPGARAPKQQHRFAEPVFIAADKSKTGFAQSERACVLCPAVKVTVHGKDGSAWREWRVNASAIQADIADPPCVPLSKAAP